MACILAGIISLLQHKNSIQEKPEIYNIENCPFCSKAALWRHGYRFRKPDRENDEKSTLNPIPILRMYCSSCRRTCSVLPECIPQQFSVSYKTQNFRTIRETRKYFFRTMP
jgi:hypothetical protein